MMNRSEIMSRIRSKETKFERDVRKALWAKGARGYRKNWKGAIGKPDVAWPRLKLVVFLDSCFWHKCPEHGKIPKTNVGFWKKKLERNRARDAEVNRILKKGGWTVLRFWSHCPIEEIVEKIIRQKGLWE